MIQIKDLSQTKHTEYCNKISLMVTMVFEELYRLYHNCNQAPYDYYNADYIISPKNRSYHDEYFAKVKPLAIELAELWQQVLANNLPLDENDLEVLNAIKYNIVNAKDMVYLVWYATFLLKAVRSFYAKNNMKWDGTGKQFWKV
ncbi:hypothetical protein [Nitratiruptor tergarcus]|uniref:Uncharacterized protein n=1 Tax=Nitratiruptor tergarcus DSM 16512 TaxID=1069081 RepID=A0A1W1WUS8_9BACT|nr:hypothetical protein [Nitratiruptor tergarcus]SMC10081.1 hypothetical protein SAMN05660197_1918 [Nitratiruptor tergarcus DSM 16512]